MSAPTETTWVPVIGLEVHCQLKTASKIFCGCANRFGAPPNTLTCPVCTGQPGALPVLNDTALDLALRAGLALDCELASVSRFDRKNYFYCDLPKGYQITQYEVPFASGGGIELANGKHIRLTRIHMEEDAGKAIHDRGTHTLVDLNRAGVPLIEIVTEADMQSAAEAFEFLGLLKERLRFAGVSDCDMEKGSLRCDVNVSVHLPDEPWRTKVEVKNLNSFRHVRTAIEHEIARQISAYESEDPSRQPVQETRLFDVDSGTTRPMRGKEDEGDYRYFPDPDLVPVSASRERLEEQRRLLPELPAQRRERYVSEWRVGAREAAILTADRPLADFFEATVRALAENEGGAQAAAKWLTNDVLRIVGEQGTGSLSDMPLTPGQLARVISLVEGGELQRKGAQCLLARLITEGGEVDSLVVELGLAAVTDDGQLRAWCLAALAGRESVAAQVRAGNEKAIGALMGPVMGSSGGRADPARVRALLLELIREDGP
ncbi:MAG: Asp-tRNA(Asn)/Glu-tRNA(Gln) amidotransferase subunit GatB [Planctomycetota bacterium]|nr:Asp-tRNA(Asn)/Glu-tRNA(Gln) amidotransferase GatCAB subunit B [Planctomycetota bacterium]MDP6839360.1 Asp-tRNA(Asn)/Glu-tRNA(Gln) amidotransferase subunit GatB [Planctomycetota bacterium]